MPPNVSLDSILNHFHYLTAILIVGFAVNGSGIPEVDFDVGESYAGLLPISSSPNETRQLFFWFGKTSKAYHDFC